MPRVQRGACVFELALHAEKCLYMYQAQQPCVNYLECLEIADKIK